MENGEAIPVRILSWIAGAVALLVALLLPAFYFSVTYQYHAGALKTTTEIKARIVTDMINTTPEMWRFQDHYLTDLLARGPGREPGDFQRVVDLKGLVVARSGDDPAPPVLTWSETLYDSGQAAGRIEISRSLRPLIISTGLVAILGIALGSAVFVVLRLLPARALNRALESLFQEKERAQITLRSIGEGVITTDTSGRIVMLNKVAEELTGWTHEEAKGRPLPEIFRFRGGREAPEGGGVPADPGKDYPSPVSLVARDGSERKVVRRDAPIHDRNGNVVGVVLVIQDVTEREKIQEERQRTEKLESLGVLAGGIAHDFNNILTSITGNISLAEIDADPGSRISGRLAEAERACRRAKDLAIQLLAFSKGGAPVRRTGSIAQMLRESAGFALTGSGARCELDIAGDVRPVDLDEGQINQVIHNLVVNANQAMPDGGLIRISAGNVAVGPGSMLPLPPGDYVEIAVADQGTGIASEHLPKIFDPYFTTKSKGSGLGLAISYFIVKNHGGHITVDSEPGNGTTFRVYLPASQGRASAGGGVPAAAPARRRRILVMDDEEGVRQVAGGMLEHIGVDAEFAGEGSVAVDKFREAKEAGRPFDVVILDLTIPGGMGGRETMKRLLELEPSVIAVVSSGYSNDPVMANFRAYGFKGFLAKPYRLKDLDEAIRGVIGIHNT